MLISDEQISGVLEPDFPSEPLFVQVPTGFVIDGVLGSFVGPHGVVALKALFALAIIKGDYRNAVRRDAHVFPATLSTISAVGHLSRNDVVLGLRELVDRGVVHRVDRPARLERVKGRRQGPRTSFYCFASSPRFIKFPYLHLSRLAFLKSVRRRDDHSLRMLQAYLLIGTHRTFRTGRTRITYDTIVKRLGAERRAIHRAMLALKALDLVDIHQPSKEVDYFHYRIRGVVVDGRSLRSDPPQAEEALRARSSSTKAVP